MVVITYLVGQLLGAMQDVAGQAVLVRISQAGTVLWLMGLVVLLIALAVDSLGRGGTP